ncbi:vacuolar sorting protein VPS33/slp1, partial [Cladochytrium tenue]
MIRSVQASSKWKIVVIDAKSLKILNSTCKMHDVLEENVSLVEDISRKRTSYAQKDAIYFLSPIAESVAALIDDFSKAKPKYASAHVFFTAGRTIIHASSTDADDKLLSVFSTTGEFPFIRYHDPKGEKQSRSYKLASALQTELEELQKVDSDFPKKTAFKRPILIIVERSFDLMAPLLHEFTYQAMMNDLLVLEGGKYSYKADGEQVQQKVALDESDAIWVGLRIAIAAWSLYPYTTMAQMLIRHWHFAEAVEYIRENFNRFLNENKAAVSALGHDESASGLESLSKMKDTLTSLPQFQEMKTKFSAHINICQECKSIFERRKLDSVASVEQDLAVGETADGRVPRNAMVDMVPILDDPAVPSVDKLRLLLLYIIAQEGIQDGDRRRLLEVSRLSLEESQAITNLSLLGVRLSASNDKKAKANMHKYSYYGRVAEKKKKKKKKKGNDDQVPYDLSRFVPLVKYLIEDQIANTLDASEFPWVSMPRPEDITATASTSGRAATTAAAPATGAGKAAFRPSPNAANPYSLRTTRASWSRPRTAGGGGSGGGGGGGTGAAAGAALDSAAAAELEDARRNGPRVVVFVMGGVTFSEMRAAYEVAAEYKRDVLI